MQRYEREKAGIAYDELGDSVIDGAAASETFGSGAQRQIEYELKGKLAGPAFNDAGRRCITGLLSILQERNPIMARKKLPRRFQVCATLDNLDLARTGSAIKLEISSRGEKLGELHIGRGSLFWWGAHSKTRKRIRWSRFAEILNDMASGEVSARRRPEVGARVSH